MIASIIETIRTEAVLTLYQQVVIVLESNGLPAVDNEIDALLLAPTLKAIITSRYKNNEYYL